MKVAIIGMGYLGSQIREVISAFCVDPIITHHQHQVGGDSQLFDILQDDIRSVSRGEAVDLVFITAKVEFTEETHALFMGMRNLVRACRKSRIVYFSSDGIYDGLKGNYKEIETPNAKTLYGGNLALCEQIVREEAHNYVIIRPSYIYGYADEEKTRLDSRLSRVKQTVSVKHRVEWFSDMYRSPMHVRQVAKVSVQLANSEYQGIAHVAGPRMSVYEFVRDAVEAMGYDPSLVVGVSKSDDPKKHPPDTSLDTSLMTRLTGIVPFGVKESIQFFSDDIAH
ncbi:MAG: sugar nucleotide-binding protein [Parcubacteria group bacterium]|jgi:dTDP-4-dehydrorhamnose reductase